MTGYPYRLGTNRSNPYTEPGGYDKLRTEGHLEVYGSYLCTSRPTPAEPDANENMSQKVADRRRQVRLRRGGEPERDAGRATRRRRSAGSSASPARSPTFSLCRRSLLS